MIIGKKFIFAIADHSTEVVSSAMVGHRTNLCEAFFLAKNNFRPDFSEFFLSIYRTTNFLESARLISVMRVLMSDARLFILVTPGCTSLSLHALFLVRFVSRRLVRSLGMIVNSFVYVCSWLTICSCSTCVHAFTPVRTFTPVNICLSVRKYVDLCSLFPLLI